VHPVVAVATHRQQVVRVEVIKGVAGATMVIAQKVASKL